MVRWSLAIPRNPGPRNPGGVISQHDTPFRTRMYGIDGNNELTIRSDPRLLINMVNNLKKILKKRDKSSAPIARATIDFFANILRKAEE